MIPCHVCGKDASTGWTKGFAPAPDSQKLALCAEHNTKENRLAVVKAWQALFLRNIAVMTDIAQRKQAPSLHVATIHFSGGGMLSFTCTSCVPTPQGTLRITSPDGASTYLPLQHIREYTLRPVIEGFTALEKAQGEASALSAPPAIETSEPVPPSEEPLPLVGSGAKPRPPEALPFKVNPL